MGSARRRSWPGERDPRRLGAADARATTPSSARAGNVNGIIVGSMGIATIGGDGVRRACAAAAKVAATGEFCGDLRRARLEIGMLMVKSFSEMERRSRRRADLSSCSADGLRCSDADSFGDVDADWTKMSIGYKGRIDESAHAKADGLLVLCAEGGQGWHAASPVDLVWR